MGFSFKKESTSVSDLGTMLERGKTTLSLDPTESDCSCLVLAGVDARELFLERLDRLDFMIDTY